VPQARPAGPPRALDPATGLPFRKFTLHQSILLSAMKKLFDFFNEHFLIRRLSAGIVGAVAAINAAHVAPAITPEETATLISVVGAGTAFVFECLQKWVRLKFIKPVPQVPRI
jgi:hypothetical protein